MGSTVEHILGAVPALRMWLRRVFWVLGGYIAATGVLVVYVATTGARTGSASALAVVTVAGAMSAGWMSAVNSGRWATPQNRAWALLTESAVPRRPPQLPGRISSVEAPGKTRGCRTR